MKASFYFVLWIIIYPILGLFNNSFIDQNSFLIALVIVWGLSRLLNRSMPKLNTYEQVSQIAPILEDVYTGNIYSFYKRLTRESAVETITAIYFLVTTIVIAIAIFMFNINDWVALVVFALFTYGAVRRSITLVKAKISLQHNPTPEECKRIVNDTYGLEYDPYYEERMHSDFEHMLPPKPRYFKVFRIFSLIIACICAVFGIWYIVTGIVYVFRYPYMIEALSMAIMYFLYGTLATYFGIKDFISGLKKKRSN